MTSRRLLLAPLLAFATAACRALLTRLGADWQGAVQAGRTLDEMLASLLAR